MINIIDSKSDDELLRSIVAEIAKAQNEIKCAQSDLTKAQSRIKFLLVLANILIDRQKD